VVVWDAKEGKQRTFVWPSEALDVLKEGPPSTKLYVPRGEYVPSAQEARRSTGYRDTSPAPKKRKAKSHSITTADLIKEEVNDLRKSDAVAPPPMRPESKDKRVDLDDIEKVKPKKRKGTW
jgi:hypothetical protein